MKSEVSCHLLSKDTFQPYGSVICPDEEINPLNDRSRNANQGTAIKLINISDIVHDDSHGKSTPNLNLFRCFPHPKLKQMSNHNIETGLTHNIPVLEKHPFSTQTFIPMGGSKDEFVYLVVVALPTKHETGNDTGPDLKTLKAFLCKGNQGITYGKGIWHAPMIVVGEQDFQDFSVIIYETLDPNKPELDCVERHYIAPNNEIKVTLF